MTRYNLSKKMLIPSIRALLYSILLLSLIELAFKAIHSHSLLSLSYSSFPNNTYWQSITSLFVVSGNAISLGYLIFLSIKLIIIYGFCVYLIERKGLIRFWSSLGVEAGCTSLTAFACTYFFKPVEPFTLSTTLIATLGISFYVWSSPKLKLPLPRHYPPVSRWALIGIISLYIGIEYFNVAPFQTIILASSVLIPLTIETYLSKKGTSKTSQSSLFFKTHRAIATINQNIHLDDEMFMEAVLSKISLYGEKILTKDEKERMEIISLKKELTKAKNFLS